MCLVFDGESLEATGELGEITGEETVLGYCTNEHWQVKTCMISYCQQETRIKNSIAIYGQRDLKKMSKIDVDTSSEGTT